MVEGGGFEPPKAEPSDLQSDPFGHSGTPPRSPVFCFNRADGVNTIFRRTASLSPTLLTLDQGRHKTLIDGS